MSIVTSKVTERAQTTLPRAVRTVLGLEEGARLGYVIEGNEVRLVNASSLDEEDPVLDRFLAFLATDLAKRPDQLRGVSARLLARAKAVTRGVAIDHDAPIDGAVDI